MIRAAAVSKRFGANWALTPFSLAVETGETVAVTGPNGSGKTTLLKLIAGILRPTAGSVLIEETTPRAMKGRIGYLGHEQFLYPFLTSIENLRFWCTMYDAPTSRADELLEQVGMAHKKGALAQSLSRGEAQRLALARAVMHNPDYLLLDEPFTGLDEVGAEIVPAIIKRPGGTLPRTVVMASHDLDRAKALATTLFEMAPPRS